jgi:uncharacterized protein (DUF2384 family)
MARTAGAQRERVSQLDDRLEADLRLAVDTQDLLQLLRGRAALTQDAIATATGASLRSVRNWEHHAVRLRQRNDDRLRYFAEIVATLSATLTPRGIAQWLQARNRALTNRRPIDLIATDTTDKVLHAALDLTGGTLA